MHPATACIFTRLRTTATAARKEHHLVVECNGGDHSHFLASCCQIEDKESQSKNQKTVNQRTGDMEAPANEPENEQTDDDCPDHDASPPEAITGVLP